MRLYDHLFTKPHPEEDEGSDFRSFLNPESLQVLSGSWVEPSLGRAAPGDRFQVERLGYFATDPDTKPGKPVFNRTVSLRDEWTKLQKAGKTG